MTLESMRETIGFYAPHILVPLVIFFIEAVLLWVI